MNIGVVIGLLFGFGGLAFAAFAVVWAINKHKRDRAKVPSIVPGPSGDIVDIPVLQITRVYPGELAFAGFARNHGWASLRIHPEGVEYRLFSVQHVPFANVSSVDVPYAGQRYLTIWFHSQHTGLGVVPSNEQSLRAALDLFARRGLLTQGAYARLTQPSWGA